MSLALGPQRLSWASLVFNRISRIEGDALEWLDLTEWLVISYPSFDAGQRYMVFLSDAKSYVCTPPLYPAPEAGVSHLRHSSLGLIRY